MAKLERSEVLEMARAGVPVREIAAEMDVTVSAVYRILEEEGVGAVSEKRSVLDKLTEEQRDELVRRYLEDGVSAALLIGEYKINYNAFYKLLRERGVDIREVRSGWREGRQERLDKAIELYVKGVLVWRIIDETGIQQPMLHAELHRRGVPLRRERGGSGRGDEHTRE